MWARGSRNLPLVVIAHGFWSLTGIGSYLGYDYLARHLARWGMVVFSINMDDVNLASPTASAPHQLGRAETILAAIDALRADADLEGRIDFSRIGLVGHSVGGEAVAIAPVSQCHRRARLRHPRRGQHRAHQPPPGDCPAGHKYLSSSARSISSR